MTFLAPSELLRHGWHCEGGKTTVKGVPNCRKHHQRAEESGGVPEIAL